MFVYVVVIVSKRKSLSEKVGFEMNEEIGNVRDVEKARQTEMGTGNHCEQTNTLEPITATSQTQAVSTSSHKKW